MEIDIVANKDKYKSVQIGDTFYFIDKPKEFCLKCYDGFVDLINLTMMPYDQLNDRAMEELAEEDVVIIPTKLINK